MKDDTEVLMWIFLVLVGLSLFVAVSALAAVVWFVISAIGMQMRKEYLAEKARERIEERFDREGGNLPIEDVFVAYDVAGVEIDDEMVDDDDFLSGILIGIGSPASDG